MKKIVITGDSWGVGEWNWQTPDQYTISHNGLAQYFVENSVDVINLSQGGASNRMICQHLKRFLEANQHLTPSAIIVFQTEWTRDGNEEFTSLPHNTPVYDQFVDIDNSNRFIAAQNIAMSRYYSRLAEISQKYQVPVYVIGGMSDTMWMSKFSEEYPGVSILCQSVTNLIMNNTHRTDTPVHSCFSSTNETDIALIKKQASVEEMNSVLDDVANGIARRDVWQNNREYFYPDGKHPNREGHKILYDFVANNLEL
jgi:hypothetical protein